jgi:hypothetical protein
MQLPEMKQVYEPAASDFERYPVWIGVHNYDYGQPWHRFSDEQTFRPWTGPLPFTEERGVVLVTATFELADGSRYSGYVRAVREDWDVPLPPRRMRDGSYTKAKQWSARRCGSPLSILSLHLPVMFCVWTPRIKAAGDAFPLPIEVGDLLTWLLDGRLPHVGVVVAVDSLGPEVVHNIGAGVQENELAAFQPHQAKGHYRWPAD